MKANASLSHGISCFNGSSVVNRRACYIRHVGSHFIIESGILQVRARRSISQTYTVTSGHNKWSKIKQKKAVNDAQRSAVFGKAARDIQLAVRHGGSTDPSLNAMLAAALKKAKTVGVPKENVEKALTQAAGGGAKEGIIRTVYEAMFSKDIGILIECQTDNPARAFKRLREILSSYDARITPVSFLFERKGCVRILLNLDDHYETHFESVWDAASEAGAEDFEEYGAEDPRDKEIEMTCPPDVLAEVTNAVFRSGPSDCLLSSELKFLPKDTGIDHLGVKDDTSETDTAEKLKELVETLKQNDEYIEVWTTWDDRLDA